VGDAPIDPAMNPPAKSATIVVLSREIADHLLRNGPAPRVGTTTKHAIADAELSIQPATARFASNPAAMPPSVITAPTAPLDLPAIPYRGPAACGGITMVFAIATAVHPIQTAAQALATDLPWPALVALTGNPRIDTLFAIQSVR